MIIGIHGKFQSGKDTTADMLIKMRPTLKKKAHADKLKKIVSIIAGVPLKKLYSEKGKNIYIEPFGMTLGQMLQNIGTNALRDHFDTNVWVKALYSDYVKGRDEYVVPDVRFPNEAEYVRKMGGVLIKVEGDPLGIKAEGKSTRDPNHPSEIALDDWTDWDYVIKNDGTLGDLEFKVKNILNNVLEQYTLNSDFFKAAVKIAGVFMDAPDLKPLNNVKGKLYMVNTDDNAN